MALPNGDPLAGFGQLNNGPTDLTGNNAGGNTGAADQQQQQEVQDQRSRSAVQEQMLQDALARSASLASGRASQDSTSPGYDQGPGLNGPTLPNGAPDQEFFNRRLGDQQQQRKADATGQSDKPLPAKNTTEFYKGDYVPGKGVADADGYYDERYMSEANIEMNARRGDPAAFAKLEVMASAGNADAKAILTDLGPQFLSSETAAGFVAPHNQEINNALANGAFANNKEARLNLADQRMNPLDHVLAVKDSNPDAYQMMETLAELGGRKINFGAEGVTFVDTNGDAHRVPIGEIAQRLPQLEQMAEAHRKTQAAA